MTSTAQFTLTIPARPLPEAETWATRLEEDIRLEPLAVTINETDEAQSLWEIIGFFASREDAEAAHQIIAAPGTVITPVLNRDWVTHTLQGLAPVVAGRFFLHGSHDRHRHRAGGHSMEIDAGTAFGTGHHGTTTGCLMVLDDVLKRHNPQHILDLGTGTGVLAIAAAMATGKNVLATDIDPEAVRVTRLNASNNQMANRVKALTATGLEHAAIRQQAPYDVIMANILARPLISLAHGLMKALAPGGHLILSGLTRDQVRWVMGAYTSRGMKKAKVLLIGNWATLHLVKPGSKKA